MSVELPMGCNAYPYTSYTPRLFPVLPAYPIPDDARCATVHDAFGRCQMPRTDHGYHRTEWDGFEASWQ